MRLRLRYPDKQETIEVDNEATLIELCSLIVENSNADITDVSIKFGFPPKQLQITDHEDDKITDLGVHNGEVLIINYSLGAAPSLPASLGAGAVPASSSTTLGSTPQLYNPDNIPYIETETGQLLLHKVPDDNSCLFHAIIYSTNSQDAVTVHDLRTVVSNAILENTDGIYSEAILGRPLKEYSEWILNPQAWGGEVEITILAQFFNVEIISVDIESQHGYKFNESAGSFIVLAYSGVHYDSIIFQREKDLTDDSGKVGKFDKRGLLGYEVLESYKSLINMLNIMGYYTNTNKFQLRCGDCFKALVGEKDATEHASETGHYNFQEYK